VGLIGGLYHPVVILQVMFGIWFDINWKIEIFLGLVILEH